MKANRTKLVIGLAATILIVSIVILIIRGLLPSKPVVTGIVESAEIDVASKLPGRIDSVLVKRGDRVLKGDLLFTLQSKEIDAKVEQARGMRDAAKAKYDMAMHGARKEEKEAAEKLYLQTKHQFELAEKTWARIQNLHRDSVISTQERDQIEFQYKAAGDQMAAAKARYDMALNGARSEEIAGAEALYRQAENGLNEALAYQQEKHIYSPIDGEVSKLIVDPGEMAATGYPVVTISNRNDTWIVLQIREDLMTKIAVGKEFKAEVPGLGGKLKVSVAFISPMADFATWRATNQKGEYDLKTFEVHLRPTTKADGLRPG